MARKESRKYKALYFDIRIKDLEKYYSKANPKSAYGKIKLFLTKRNFSHEQYSGYHSKYNHFEVTNIGVNHDLLNLFVEIIDDPDGL